LSKIQSDVDLIKQLIEAKIIGDIDVIKRELFVDGGLSLAGKVTVLDAELKTLRNLVYKIFLILTGLGTIGGGLLTFLK
jgi:hypothetical protein